MSDTLQVVRDRGQMRIRPLGGAPGCLLMLVFSLLASVVLTVLLNLLAR